MKFLEKDLEQIIYESNKELLLEKGLYIEGKLLRQVKIGNYGIADLIEYKRPYYHEHFKTLCKGEIIVYELKQEKIGISAFLQALGYIKGIQSYLEKRNIAENYNYTIKLIGKEIDLNSTFIYLTDFISNDNEAININFESVFSLRNFIYEYKLDGIHFKSINNYDLINKGF